MNIFLLLCGIVMLGSVSLGFSRCHRPYLTAARSAVTGLAGLLLINLTSAATGCYIAINLCTVFISTVLSLPGVFALLIMKIIFNY